MSGSLKQGYTYVYLFSINDTTFIRVIYYTVYYLLSGSDFNGHKFNFIKCTVYSKCQKKYKKTKYYVNFSAKNVETCIFTKQCKYFKIIISIKFFKFRFAITNLIQLSYFI